jgi:hypothetical protein
MKYTPLALLLLNCLAQAAEKPGPVRGEAFDRHVKLEVTAHLDKASAAQAVGMEMDEGFVVFDVKLTPANGEKIAILRDDFLIRSDKDGQRSTPYLPTQIAGASILVVKTGYSGGAVATERRGPSWGGLGGGRPNQLPVGGPTAVGNSGGQENAVASVDEGAGKERENPLLPILQKKILEEKETSEPVQGQLYFLLEGKHKTRQIELLYKTPAGRLSVRFK